MYEVSVRSLGKFGDDDALVLYEDDEDDDDSDDNSPDDSDDGGYDNKYAWDDDIDNVNNYNSCISSSHVTYYDHFEK
jgi:hypothetical protein